MRAIVLAGPYFRQREKKGRLPDGQIKYNWCCYTCSKERANPYTKGWHPRKKQQRSMPYSSTTTTAGRTTAAAGAAGPEEQDAVALLLGLTSKHLHFISCKPAFLYYTTVTSILLTHFKGFYYFVNHSVRH